MDLGRMRQVAGHLPVAPNKELIRKIETVREAPLLTLVLQAPPAPLDDGCIGPLYDQLKAIGYTERIDLFLQSRGGKAETPWRVVSLIREFCRHFAVLVPFQAHSGATHIAIGADEIVMGPVGELSPVDPIRSHPLLPAQRDPASGQEGTPIQASVQDLKHCVQFVSEELCRMRQGDADTVSASDIICGLFEYVHPLAMGAIDQSYRLGRLITQKVLATHLDAEADRSKIDLIVQALSDEYRSHQYPISRQEVRDDLLLNVTFAEGELLASMEELLSYYFHMLNAEYREAQEAAHPIPIRNVGFIDTAAQRRARRVVVEVEPQGRATVVADQWVVPPEQPI